MNRFIVLLTLIALSSCSTDAPVSPGGLHKSGKANDYFFPYDVVIEDEIPQREGEKLSIEIITAQSSDPFTEEEIGWIRKVVDGWAEAIYAEPDYEFYHINPNGVVTWINIRTGGEHEDTERIEEGTIIKGIRLYISKSNNIRSETTGIYWASFGTPYPKRQGEGVLPFAALLHINSAYVETEWEYSAVTAHEIGHILGIGIERGLWGKIDGMSYSCSITNPWMKHVADASGAYFYDDDCLPRMSQIDPIVQEKMGKIGDERGFFFLGDNVLAELFRLTDFDVPTGAMIDSNPQGGSNLRFGGIRMHPHFNWEVYGHDIMSKYGPMFYELGDYPATSLTLAAIQDMGIDTDSFFARDTKTFEELPAAKPVATDLVLGCGAILR